MTMCVKIVMREKSRREKSSRDYRLSEGGEYSTDVITLCLLFFSLTTTFILCNSSLSIYNP